MRNLLKIILKQLFSFILPVTVLVLIPLSIEENIRISFTFISVTGLIFIFIGLLILIQTISTFIRIGKGTLAPWSPTKRLVTAGIYRYVRNPMITGVLTILIGESLTFQSLNLFIWAVFFFFINNIFFVLYEEPDLEKKFGDEYINYKRNVKRWIPKLKPFRSETN